MTNDQRTSVYLRDRTRLTRRDQILRAVRLYAVGARTDIVVNAFTALGIDVCRNPEHLRAVAQLAVELRMGEAPSGAALALLGCEEVAA